MKGGPLVVVGKTAESRTTTTTHSLKNLPNPRVSLEVVVVVHKRTEKSPQLQPPDQLLKPEKLGMAMTLKQLMMTPRKADEGLAPQDARRRFELPYDQDVQAELNVVQWEQTKGSELYTFSHPEGSHDDKFWAIAMAVTAAMKREPEAYIAVIPR